MDCPEHFTEIKFFRSDNRLNAGGEFPVESELKLPNTATTDVAPAFSEGGEFCDVHPFSGFAAFME